MPAAHTPLEMYHDALRNAHAMCKEAQTVYRAQADHAAKYPDVAARLREQAEVTARQVSRLEQALGAQDRKASGFKDAVTSTIGAVAELGHAMTGDTVLKDYFVAASFAGLTHTAFRSLKTSADLAGQSTADIDASISECEVFGRAVYENVDQVTRDYTALVLRGGETSPT